MRDEQITELLSDDFNALASAFEDDDFARTLRSRVEARKRARAGVLVLVGMLGAGVAAAQVNLLLDSAKQTALLFSLSAGYVSALAASMIIAAAVISTAIVLQREG